MPADELEAALIDWYEEEPVEERAHNIVLWQSGNAKTWTLVQYISDDVACSLDHGEN